MNIAPEPYTDAELDNLLGEDNREQPGGHGGDELAALEQRFLQGGLGYRTAERKAADRAAERDAAYRSAVDEFNTTIREQLAADRLADVETRRGTDTGSQAGDGGARTPGTVWNRRAANADVRKEVRRGRARIAERNAGRPIVFHGNLPTTNEPNQKEN